MTWEAMHDGKSGQIRETGVNREKSGVNICTYFGHYFSALLFVYIRKLFQTIAFREVFLSNVHILNVVRKYNF